jgi:hypothetical protein
MTNTEYRYDQNGECKYGGEDCEEHDNIDFEFEKVHIINEKTKKWRKKTEIDIIKFQKDLDINIAKRKLKELKNKNKMIKPKVNNNANKVIKEKMARIDIMPSKDMILPTISPDENPPDKIHDIEITRSKSGNLTV